MAEGLLQSIQWERESYPSYSDFAALPLFAIFFPTLRFFLDRIVFEVSEDRRIDYVYVYVFVLRLGFRYWRIASVFDVIFGLLFEFNGILFSKHRSFFVLLISVDFFGGVVWVWKFYLLLRSVLLQSEILLSFA